MGKHDFIKRMTAVMLCAAIALSVVSCGNNDVSLDDEDLFSEESPVTDAETTVSTTGVSDISDPELEGKYEKAVDIVENHKKSEYQAAYDIFTELKGYKDSDSYLANFRFRPTAKKVTSYYADGSVNDIADIMIGYDNTGAVTGIQGESGTRTYISYEDGLFIEMPYEYNAKYIYTDGLITQKDVGYQSSYYYSYNEEGKLTDIVYKYDDPTIRGETKITQYSHHYDYDEAGFVVNCVDNLNDKDEVLSTYKYNDDGKLAEVEYNKIERYPGDYSFEHEYDVTFEVNTVFSYNDKGQCVSVKYLDAAGLGYVGCDTGGTVSDKDFYFISEFTYDEHGCIVKDDLYAVVQGTKTLTETSEYGNIAVYYCD